MPGSPEATTSVSNVPEYMPVIWSGVSTRLRKGLTIGGFMKAARVLAALVLGVFISSSALAGGYPKGPDAQMTPGEVCHNPSELRYPEKIPYCKRNVDTSLKVQIIKAYDQNLGFAIQTMPRSKFKIDHYIPLCMGGSNEKENLWPQHESVFTLTDPLEQEACEKMADGSLPQAKAIELIRQAKNDLSKIAQIRAYVHSL